MKSVIEVEGLTKRFGRLTAVDGVSFSVEEGEIFGLLGENGAGKTTTIETIEGFLRPDGGTVRVLGRDPLHAHRDWRDRIGLVLQESDFDPLHSVRETLALFASFFSDPRDVAETLALVGLSDKAGERVGRLSGGQKRRVDVALGIVGRPELLFLDEPTTGFDPVARREFWEVIEGLRDSGTSMILTTHYMEEAERLCDRLAIMARGRIVAEGTSASLIKGMGATTIRFDMPADVELSVLREVAGAPFHCHEDLASVSVGGELDEVLWRLLEWSRATSVPLHGLEVLRPTLNDVFLGATKEEP